MLDQDGSRKDELVASTKIKGLDRAPRSRPASSVRSLSETEKAWLAGVVDGEGSIYISKVMGYHNRRGFSYMAYLSVANSNEDFVRKVREIIGTGFVGVNKEKRLEWKDKCEYKGSSAVLRRILPQILPDLLIKREVAERMLEYLSFIELRAYPKIRPDGQAGLIR